MRPSKMNPLDYAGQMTRYLELSASYKIAIETAMYAKSISSMGRYAHLNFVLDTSA